MTTKTHAAYQAFQRVFADQFTPSDTVRAVNLWTCAGCKTSLFRPWSPCRCRGLAGNRYLVTPLGLVPQPRSQATS